MESNPVNPQDIVNRAAEVLERDGWTQHTAHNREDGTHCLLGAVGLAAAELYNSQMDAFLYSEEHAARLEGQNALDLVAEQIVKDYGEVVQTYCDEEHQAYLDSLAPHERVHIPSWNDSPQRTVEDVLLILKKAGHDG
jgi:hypothetical protein